MTDHATTIDAPLLLDAGTVASDYIGRGWPVVPLPPRQKAARIKGWQERTFTPDDFGREDNIAVKNGEPSGLLDVDLDDPIAYELAREFLPATGATFGHGQTPQAHWIYECDAPGRTRQHKGADGAVIVELRGTGGLTMFPGSIHPSGEPVEWCTDVEPACVTRQELEAACEDLAAAVRKAKGEPAQEPPRPAPPQPTPATAPMPAPDDHQRLLRRAERYADAGKPSVVGGRNPQAFSLAGNLAAFTEGYERLTEGEILHILRTRWNARNDPPLPERELVATVHSAMVNGQARPEKPGTTVPQAAEQATRPDGEVIVKSKAPVSLAKALLRDTMTEGGACLLRRYRGEFFRYDGTCCRPMTDEALDVAIYQFLSRVVVEHTNHETGEVVRAKIPAKSSIVREIHLALPSCRDVLLENRIEAPCWLDGDDARPDPRRIFVFRNGCFDLATAEFSSPDPMLFNLSASDFDYAPDAQPPHRWLAFIKSIWGDDRQSIELLQDWLGYLLGSDTSQQKILLNVGPKRSGKGTIARVATHLLGRENCGSPTLASLSQNFGLQPLIHKRAAFISDARLSSRADQAVIAERLLSVSGEDSMTVDRKYLTPWTGRIGARFTIMTNELPRLGDASGALSSRFLLLKMTKSFYGHENHRLTDDLLAELPGIFHWARAGWKRLQSRGHFVMPTASNDALQELEDLTSPVAAFVRDECTVGPGHWIECGVLYTRWVKWCDTQGRVHPGTQATFGRDLAAAIPTLLRPRKVDANGGRFYAYDGIQ